MNLQKEVTVKELVHHFYFNQDLVFKHSDIKEVTDILGTTAFLPFELVTEINVLAALKEIKQLLKA